MTNLPDNAGGTEQPRPSDETAAESVAGSAAPRVPEDAPPASEMPEAAPSSSFAAAPDAAVGAEPSQAASESEGARGEEGAPLASGNEDSPASEQPTAEIETPEAVVESDVSEPAAPAEPTTPAEPAATGEAEPSAASAGEGGQEASGATLTAAALAEADRAEQQQSEEPHRDWYILKVQSNREDTIREALLRRAKIQGLDKYFGDVIVPTETVTEFKGGKKRIVKRKLYPGYIVVNMEINDETWFLVRDTPGIGDFTGAAGKPVPMQPHEVARILAKEEEKTAEAPKLKIGFKPGDRVKINEGTFENFEGEVESIDEANGRVTVMINIFGRSTPVELEYWQVESV